MEAIEYIHLAESQELKNFLSEQRAEVLSEMEAREADSSVEFQQWAASRVAKLQLLNQLEYTLQANADHARREIKRKKDG